ncbi:MAG: acyl carrier protein [Lachnospiraceae bacterium]|jgi:acyl carrier protein|nr:acyl carrier protein [Lachnospiraceae bacterium]
MFSKTMIFNKIIKCMVEIGIIIEASLEGRFIDEDIDDSLTYISFIVEIEEEFNISIPDEYLQADIIETYDDVAEMIQQLL